MIGDNDAGGIATYTRAGQDYSTSLLIPVLVVNPEMVVRLGTMTRVGHARLIFARFGRFWGAFPVGDLFLLNFLSIVTEFIGFALALHYFGISPLLSVPLAVVGLIVVTVTGQLSLLGGRHVDLCADQPADDPIRLSGVPGPRTHRA
jgi:Mn2+/Fe2+ NRAMP family transporter